MLIKIKPNELNVVMHSLSKTEEEFLTNAQFPAKVEEFAKSDLLTLRGDGASLFQVLNIIAKHCDIEIM